MNVPPFRLSAADLPTAIDFFAVQDLKAREQLIDRV